MTSSSLFLWPVSRLPSPDCFTTLGADEARVEKILENIYPGSHAVLFSSGRSGLTAILQLLSLKRDNLVWCPPFSGHCVLEAISRVATPTTLHAGNIKAALVYRQWGHPATYDYSDDATIIDDAVDALFIPGKNVMAAKARFTLWSLPKVLKTLTGGVVFCRHAEDAAMLRQKRDARGRSSIHVLYRVLSKISVSFSEIWNGTEALQGGLPYFACAQIESALKSIDGLVEERLGVIKRVSPSMAEQCKSFGVLPSNIPVQITENTSCLISGVRPDISTGTRHFNTGSAAAPRWEKTIPFPVHADVDQKTLQSMLDKAGPELPFLGVQS